MHVEQKLTAPFHGQVSPASLIFTTKPQRIPGTHLIYLRWKRAIQLWNHPVVLDPGTLDWQNRQLHSVHAPLSAGVLSLQPNFEKGRGLDRTSIFRGGCRESRGDLFQGGGGEGVAVFT